MGFGKKVPIVGLDVGSRTLNIAKLEDTKHGFKLKKFGTRDIPPGLIEEGSIKNPDEVARALRELFKVYKIKEKNVAISIGGDSIIVKNISIQSMEEEKLQETIHFEAEQYIPFDISDVNLDFQILGEDPSNPNQMNVLLVAAKKEIVQEYANLIQMAGLVPYIIDVDFFAMQNIYEDTYDTENQNVALIDIGSSKTALNILKGDLTMLTRDVSLGCGQINQQIVSRIGCSIEEAEQLYHSEQSGEISSRETEEIVMAVANDWCSEIRRVLDYFYSTYPSDQVKKILLSGGGANIKKFRQLLAEETSTEVGILNPFEKFSMGGGFDPSYLERIAPQAAICLGLAMRRVDDK